jgi:hypothetical protein
MVDIPKLNNLRAVIHAFEKSLWVKTRNAKAAIDSTLATTPTASTGLGRSEKWFNTCNELDRPNAVCGAILCT